MASKTRNMELHSCKGLDAVTNVRDEVNWLDEYGWNELRSKVPREAFVPMLNSCISETKEDAVETSLPAVGSKEALPSKDPFDDVDMIRSSFRKIVNEEKGKV